MRVASLHLRVEGLKTALRPRRVYATPDASPSTFLAILRADPLTANRRTRKPCTPLEESPGFFSGQDSSTTPARQSGAWEEVVRAVNRTVQ
jgi:hypothetical protein